MQPFEEFLRQLGDLLDLPLALDENLACSFNINETLNVQLEHDIDKDAILIAAYVGETPPGSYRENILEGALLENMNTPMFGIFSYLAYSNQLILHKYLPFQQTRPQEFTGFLTEFIDKALLWQKTIRQGNPPPISTLKETSKKNPFTLGQ